MAIIKRNLYANKAKAAQAKPTQPVQPERTIALAEGHGAPYTNSIKGDLAFQNMQAAEITQQAAERELAEEIELEIEMDDELAKMQEQESLLDTPIIYSTTTSDALATEILPADLSDDIEIEYESTPLLAQPASASKKEVLAAFDLDAALDSVDQHADVYGGDLHAAMKGLMTLVHREGVSLEDLRTGFIQVNQILLDDPTKCTEIMLPAHIGELCLAAQKLSKVSIETGEAGQTKRATNKKKKAIAAGEAEPEELEI